MDSWLDRHWTNNHEIANIKFQWILRISLLIEITKIYEIMYNHNLDETMYLLVYSIIVTFKHTHTFN